ncbi:hypothetical protein [uncultured Fibrobacter sp.]|uniref:hypothetical protein n=1 Tax=uncultured Fibrobacter sp. TaxID=261512 RepID=UPI0025E9002A|nr:hypothetical protein [uncultured Fibrobacter sp.]
MDKSIDLRLFCILTKFDENLCRARQTPVFNNGVNMAYYCKKCGQKFEGANAMWSLLNMSCVERGGKHEPYEGRETGPYHCKKCGKEYDGPNAMWTLVHMSCIKGGRCEPF